MSIQEPAAEPVITSPVQAIEPPVARPGRSRARWLVAGGITVAVVAVAAAATLLLTGAAGTPDVLAWVPSDSVAYTELRLDLPGDQQAALARTMSAFPGFADQAAFNTKLGEALDSLVHRATNDKHGYLADIAPWFGGQLSASVGPIPTSAAASDARVLLLASVKDGAKASAWADATLKDSGATSSTETYAGVTITVVTPPASPGSTMTAKAAWASLGPVIALGDLASIKAAIDTGGKHGLATNAQFQAAAATITGDRLAFGYVDVASITTGARALAGSAAASAMPSLPAALTDLGAPWAAMALRAQDGGFVVQTRMPHVSLVGPGGSGDARLPSVVPADTVVLVEGRTVGQTLERLKTTLAADPSLADGIKQVDTTLGLIGGFGGIVDWMDEVGVAITRDGSSVSGGVVVVPSDAAAATRLLAQLKAAITLAASSTGGAGATDETYNDATITTLDLSSLGPVVSGLAGGMLPGGDTGAGTPSIPGNLFLSYAATDKVVVFGPDVAFVKAVLDARAGPSLAGTDRFKAAIAATGPAGGALVWVDVSAIRDLLETTVPSADQSAYTADFKPYLDAFDSVIGTYAPGATIDSGTLDIRLRKP